MQTNDQSHGFKGIGERESMQEVNTDSKAEKTTVQGRTPVPYGMVTADGMLGSSQPGGQSSCQ